MLNQKPLNSNYVIAFIAVLFGLLITHHGIEAHLYHKLNQQLITGSYWAGKNDNRSPPLTIMIDERINDMVKYHYVMMLKDGTYYHLDTSQFTDNVRNLLHLFKLKT